MMQTIGLIGGLSWHSSAQYYRLINEDIQRRYGGHHSARLLMSSLDFDEIRAMQRRDAWDEAGEVLARAGCALQAAGADLLLICSNLMHKVADRVEAATSIPLLHIADSAGALARRRGITRLGILGARGVMEEGFYRARLAAHGVTAAVPHETDRRLIDRVIFDELTRGLVREPSRAAYRGAIGRLADRGADGVLLACTEIGLLVSADDSPLPVIDSTAAHAGHAVQVATRDAAAEATSRRLVGR